jgi:tetratricopeptide (TPR) repeat protein
MLILPALLAALAALAGTEPPEYVEGNRLIAKGDYEAALSHFENLRRQNPSDPLPLQRLAYTRIRMGDFEEAEKLAGKSLDVLGEPHSVSYFLIGKSLQGLGNQGGARAAFERGAEAGYRSGDRTSILGALFCRFNAGLLASFVREDEAAIGHFEEVLKLDKSNAYARYEMGIIAARQGRGEGALTLFEEALRNKLDWSPQEMWVYPVQRYVFFGENVKTRMASLLLEMERAEDVLELLTPVHDTAVRRARSKPVQVKGDPLGGTLDCAFEDAGFWMGSALADLGRRQEAREMFKEWARLRIGTPDLRQECKRLTKELK